MRRRTFVASAVGLMAAAAVDRRAALAQPATAPARPPEGKVVRAAPCPRAIGEFLGVAINGKLHASQGLLPGFKPAGLVYEYDPARDAWTEKKPKTHPH